MSKKEKIAMVLGSAFPSSKAYAVTSRETCRVLDYLGFQVKIFGHKSAHTDEDFQYIKHLNENLSDSVLGRFFVNFGKSGRTKLNFICWRLGVALNLQKSKKIIYNFNPTIIWVRDPMIAYICLRSFPHAKIILEVHDESGKFFMKKLLKNTNTVNYFPINEQNLNFLSSLNKEISCELAPMGVRTNILSNQTLVHEFVEHLKFKNFRNLRIAYVGKFSPGGYSKGYEDLINLSHKFKDSDYYNEITIVGADKNEMIGLNKNRLKSNVNSDKLKFVKHLSHTEALRIMKSFDVLVLPAPLNSKYIGMPIKLLEYLAVGRVTVIANCDLFNSFFDSSFKPYSYEASNPVSLNEAIIKAVNDPALEARINSGVDYASKFTWEERTIKIMTYLREADS